MDPIICFIVALVMLPLFTDPLIKNQYTQIKVNAFAYGMAFGLLIMDIINRI